MSGKTRPWTPEEDMIALTMKAGRATPREIADKVLRTRGAVSARLSYLALTPEVRKQKRREKRGAPKLQPTVVRQRITQASMRFVPPEVQADRERRQLAEQPAFGDPPRGFSALDRRQAGASA